MTETPDEEQLIVIFNRLREKFDFAPLAKIRSKDRRFESFKKFLDDSNLKFMKEKRKRFLFGLAQKDLVGKYKDRIIVLSSKKEVTPKEAELIESAQTDLKRFEAKPLKARFSLKRKIVAFIAYKDIDVEGAKISQVKGTKNFTGKLRDESKVRVSFNEKSKKFTLRVAGKRKGTIKFK